MGEERWGRRDGGGEMGEERWGREGPCWLTTFAKDSRHARIIVSGLKISQEQFRILTSYQSEFTKI